MRFSRFLFLLAFPMLQAHPVVTVAQLDQSFEQSLTIVSPSDPAFEPSIEHLIASSNLQLFRPILPYSIIIRNNTKVPILAIVVYADVVDGLGRKSSITQTLSRLPPMKNGPVALKPDGGEAFFAVDEAYSAVAEHLGNGGHLPQDFSARTRDRPALYDAAKSISFVVDSVLYADGKFVGPDRKRAFEEYTSQLAAEAALAKAVLAYQNRNTDGLSEFLTAVAVAQGQTTTPTTYSRLVSREARGYGAYLRRKGAAALFDIAKLNQERATSLSIHR